MKVQKNELAEALEQGIRRHKVAGASVAVLDGEEVVAAAAGVTNIETGVPVTLDTVMHIGSITKIFNATLVMQLVDEGLIALDEPVVRYLPDLRLGDRRALGQITVKMLLNHTSGIDGDMLPDQGHDEETIERAVRRFAELGQLYQPGAEFSYCNAGSVIAGYLVQRLRGAGWYRVMREKVFAPLGLERAATLPEEALLHRASVGHHLDGASGKLIRTSFAFLPLGLAPCGTTLMMSASDLITFVRAHLDGGTGPNGRRILSEKSAKAMQSITVRNAGKGYTYVDMGLGWMVSEDGLLSHGGGGPGIASMLYVYPPRRWAAAILTNCDHSLALINDFMEPWLREFGTVKPFGRRGVSRPSGTVAVEPNHYLGSYEDVALRYDVALADGALTLSRRMKFAWYDTVSTEPTPPAPLVPLGNHQFLAEASGDAQNAGSADEFRVYTFRNPATDGRMRHLGSGLHLYPRSHSTT